jgi:hypothetical protein
MIIDIKDVPEVIKDKIKKEILCTLLSDIGGDGTVLSMREDITVENVFNELRNMYSYSEELAKVQLINKFSPSMLRVLCEHPDASIEFKRIAGEIIKDAAESMLQASITKFK